MYPLRSFWFSTIECIPCGFEQPPCTLHKKNMVHMKFLFQRMKIGGTMKRNNPKNAIHVGMTFENNVHFVKQFPLHKALQFHMVKFTPHLTIFKWSLHTQLNHFKFHFHCEKLSRERSSGTWPFSLHFEVKHQVIHNHCSNSGDSRRRGEGVKVGYIWICQLVCI